jgi:threonyl-tRNA synthetase
VADRHNGYAAQAASRLRDAGVRCTVDERSESVGKKIHDAEVGKYPYMLVVGDREESEGAVSVRSHAEGDVGAESIDAFAARIEREVSDS